VREKYSYTKAYNEFSKLNLKTLNELYESVQLKKSAHYIGLFLFHESRYIATRALKSVIKTKKDYFYVKY